MFCQQCHIPVNKGRGLGESIQNGFFFHSLKEIDRNYDILPGFKRGTTHSWIACFAESFPYLLLFSRVKTIHQALSFTGKLVFQKVNVKEKEVVKTLPKYTRNGMYKEKETNGQALPLFQNERVCNFPVRERNTLKMSCTESMRSRFAGAVPIPMPSFFKFKESGKTEHLHTVLFHYGCFSKRNIYFLRVEIKLITFLFINP